MSPLTCYEPCPACNRHVVTDEAVCPFCAAPLPECFSEVKRKPLRGRMSRAGLLAAGAGATLISACLSASAYGGHMPYDAGSVTDGPDGAAGAGGAPVAEYGAPPSFSEDDSEHEK
jgi:hypothetical protein